MGMFWGNFFEAIPTLCSYQFSDNNWLRACLEIQSRPPAGLLPLAGVDSALAARCGDARPSSPWPAPKSLAAGPLSIFRQALKVMETRYLAERINDMGSSPPEFSSASVILLP